MKKRSRLVVILLFISVFFSSIVSNNIVFADNGGKDISQTAVTSLSVSPDSIDDGGNTTVRMEFDETNGNIQSGDKITVSWASSGDAYFMGYSKTVPLAINGQIVGEAIITINEATIIFNERVDRLDNVRGWIAFEVQGRNVTDTSQEDTKNAMIQSGSKSANVFIRKPEAGTTGVFYYKTGDMLPEDTEHVRWFLVINNENVHSDDRVYIEDTIQPGQQLIPESFEIIITGAHSDTFYGKDAISDFESTYPGTSISYDVLENRIVAIIPQGYVSLNKISIMYLTQITNSTQEYFKNNTKAWYKEHGKEAVAGGEFNHNVKNINASGGITGTVKGELKILKMTKDSKTPIPDVVFQLEKEDDSVIKDGLTKLELTTDSQGIANVKGLSVGKYVVKEINAPSWIEFDPILTETIKFEIKDTDSEGILLNVENATKTISIPVVKQWVGKVGDCAKIKLLADGIEVQAITLNAGNQWKHIFADQPKYNKTTGNEIMYTLSEVSIEGYNTVITGDSKTGFTVTNTVKDKVSVGVTKQWIGKTKDSITINLLADGKKEKSQVLNENNNWQYTFTNLAQYKGGKKISYSVSEDELVGYKTEITGDISNGFIIKNVEIIAPLDKDKTNPKTGNDTNILLHGLFFLISGAGILIIRRELTKF